MYFSQNNDRLIAKRSNETVLVEPWGKNAPPVRATQNSSFLGGNKALSDKTGTAEITVNEHYAEIQNGKLRCVVYDNGHIEFLNETESILSE